MYEILSKRPEANPNKIVVMGVSRNAELTLLLNKMHRLDFLWFFQI